MHAATYISTTIQSRTWYQDLYGSLHPVTKPNEPHKTKLTEDPDGPQPHSAFWN